MTQAKGTTVRDLASVAGPLGVPHLCLFTRTEIATYLKLAKFPRGPTLTFRWAGIGAHLQTVLVWDCGDKAGHSVVVFTAVPSVEDLAVIAVHCSDAIRSSLNRPI